MYICICVCVCIYIYIYIYIKPNCPPKKCLFGKTQDYGKRNFRLQINQPTRCNSFTSLLLDVYVWLNMFRAPLRPSSGAYNFNSSLWFYRWSVVVGVSLVVVWHLPDHDQKCSNRHSPTVKPEAASAVVCS